MNNCFMCNPTVFAVEDKYQIIVPVNCEMLFWVEIGGKRYYDEYNGIMRTSTSVHRVDVKQADLDKAERYTVCFRKIIERKPYFTESEPEEKVIYRFKPIKKTENINIYQLADTHGMIDEAVAAAGYFGNDLDLLVLNGDIADHSGSIENISICYKIASEVTRGEIPCVFSRGNHDLRGECAEVLADYTPSNNGNTYYWFKVGKIFGITVDCGEDKNDNHPEYGYTVCCDEFRKRETDFIRNAASSKRAKEADFKLIVSHVPFTWDNTEKDRNGDTPFNIEVKRFTLWARLLKKFNPQLMLCGHLHSLHIWLPGCKDDFKGQPCPVIVGSKPDFKNKTFIGTALTLNKGEATVRFTDEKNGVKEETVIPFL